VLKVSASGYRQYRARQTGIKKLQKAAENRAKQISELKDARDCTRRSNNPSLKRPGIPVAQPE
jgi:hypothetical protein